MKRVAVRPATDAANTDDVFGQGVLPLLQIRNEQQLYREIVRLSKRIVSATYGTILLERNGVLRRVFADSEVIARTEVSPEGRSVSAYRENAIRTATVASRGDIHPQQFPLGIKTIIFVPLSCDVARPGILNLLTTRPYCCTEEKRTQLKLLSAFASLAIYTRAQLREKQQAINTRDLFMSLASHELKNPLTAINIYAQQINAQVKSGILPKPDWTARLLRETQRIMQLNEELLQLNQIRRGKLIFRHRRQTVGKIIRQAILLFREAHPDRTVIPRFLNRTGAIDTGAVDQHKLIQAITNLLNNAAKFSDRNSPIRLTYTVQPTRLILRIRDHGKGIPADEIVHIFEPFNKGKRKPHQGMGLGLYLTKLIVDNHKGTITIRRARPRGTEITLILPRVP